MPAIEDASLLTPSSRSPSEAEGVDEVVERRVAEGGVGVEEAVLAAGGHRHADGVADALAERTGGGLDAGRVAVLRVARGLAAPRAQRLEVLELEAPAAEVELDVERHARVAARQHEPVAARPVRVGRVVAHHLLEQEVRRRSQAHRRAGVAVADLLHGVHRQHPDGVDRQVVGLVPVQLRHGFALARSAQVTVRSSRHGLARYPLGRFRAYSCRGLDSTPLPSPSRDTVAGETHPRSP